MTDEVVITVDEIQVVLLDESAEIQTIEVGIQGPQGPPGDGGSNPRINIGHTGGAFLLWQVPANSVIKRADLQVKQPYNDPLARVSIGTDSNRSLLMAEDENKVQGTGIFRIDMDLEILIDTDIKVFLTSAGTVGAGTATLTYIPK